MNYTEAVAQISRNKIASIYLLYGEEPFLVRELVHVLIDALLPGEEKSTGLTVLDGDASADNLQRLVETAPFFNEKNVILVRGTTGFRPKKTTAANDDDEEEGIPVDAQPTDKDSEKLLRIIAAIPSYSHLIFVAEGKVDKRKKLYKAIEKYGATVELAPLKLKEVRPWIIARLAAANKKMTADAIEHLLAIISIMPQVSLGFLDNELDKAALFAGNRATVTRSDLIATLAQVPEASVFVMIEALSQKQIAKAITMLDEQLTAGEPPFRIIALLGRQIRLLWQVKQLSNDGYGVLEIANELKVRDFVSEKLLRQSKSFSLQALQAGLHRLACADRDLKSGKTDSRVLEECIIELCQ